MNSRDNSLLAAFGAHQLSAWQPFLLPIELRSGDVLYEIGRSSHHVYFPLTAIVTIQTIAREGGSCQVALIGREGLVGVPAALGVPSANTRALVQHGGSAFKLPAGLLNAELTRGGAVAMAFVKYVETMFAQASQTATCNRHHTPEQQLSVLLLRTTDRHASTSVALTHDLLANMLGLRRETISQAARRLQDKGCLQYSRGHIKVLDRKALETGACHCYEDMQRAFGP